MFDSLNDNRRRTGFNRYWPTGVHVSDKTISLKPLVVKRTRSLQRKLPPIKNGCRVIWTFEPLSKKTDKNHNCDLVFFDTLFSLYLFSFIFV